MSEKRKDRDKDAWDKFAALSTFLSSFLLALIALIFTIVSARQEAADRELERHTREQLDKAQTLEKFLPHLVGTETQKRAALAAIKALGYDDLATELAISHAGTGSVAFLETVAVTGNRGKASAAVDALKRLGSTDTQMSSPESSKRTPAQALRSVAAATDDAVIKKAATEAVEKLLEGARRASVTVGSDVYAGGVIVSQQGLVITAPLILDMLERRNRPVFVRLENGQMFPVTVERNDKELGLAAVKLEKDRANARLVPIALAEHRPAVGDKAWFLSVTPSAAPVPVTVTGYKGTRIIVKTETDLLKAGVYAGAPLVNERNELLGVIDPDHDARGEAGCIDVGTIRSFVSALSPPAPANP